MITQEQIKLVQDSFRKVEPIADVAADIFYTQLFEIDPALKKLFTDDMKRQKQKLMAALKMIVNALDNLEPLLPAIEELSIRHDGYGIEDKDYASVGNALLRTLSEGLGDEFTQDIRDAWVEAYKILSRAMKKFAADARAAA